MIVQWPEEWPIPPDWLYDSLLPAWVELYWPPATDEVPEPRARFRAQPGEIDSAFYTPERAAGLVRWQIPIVVSDDRLWDLLTEMLPLARRVIAGLRVDRDGEQFVQRLTGSAQQARDEIAERLASLVSWPRVEARHVDTAVPPEVLQAAIDADTDDAGLAAVVVVEQLRASLAPDQPGNYVVLDGAEERLEDIRAAARQAVREQLVVAVGDERDRLIRRIARWVDPTDTLSSLADQAGMPRIAVQQILNETEQAGADAALADVARSRAVLDRLGLVAEVPAFPNHHAEYRWWKDIVTGYVAQVTDPGCATEAVFAVTDWHQAWLATQPQNARTRTYHSLGTRLQMLADRVREPDAYPHHEPIDERQQLDRVIAELTVIRDDLA